MNRKWLRFVIALAGLAAAGAWGFSLLGRPAAMPASDGRLQVVAAENFWGDIVGQIGGDRVRVTSIISDPSADPHSYESNAGNASAVAGADLVLYNGLGYDDFMSKLLNGAPHSGRKTIIAAAASGAPEGSNPHIWYDMSMVRRTAEAIASALESKDPQHAAQYQNNLRMFEISLKAVTAAQAKISGFYGGAAAAYTERVPEYLIHDTGLVVASPAGFARAIEDGSEPSPADMAAMRKLLTARGARVLFYNSQAGSAATDQIKTLAQQSGVPVVAVSETMPTDQPSFQSWQLSQIKKLEEALSVY